MEFCHLSSLAPPQNRIERLIGTRALQLMKINRWNRTEGPSLLDLPLDVHLIIQSFIPLYDLHTHLAFAHVLQQGGHTYLAHYNESFWMRVCRARRLGRPNSMKSMSFHTVASRFICHYLLCEFDAACVYHFKEEIDWDKETLTERSEHPMSWVISVFEKDVYTPQETTQVQEYHGFKTILKFGSPGIGSKLFPRINFRVMDPPPEAPCEQHAVSGCLFATVPSLQAIQLNVMDIETILVENEGGVTVGDVHEALRSWYHKPLNFNVIDRLFERYKLDSPAFRALKPLWNESCWELRSFLYDQERIKLIGETGKGRAEVERMFELLRTVETDTLHGLSIWGLLTRLYAGHEETTGQQILVKDALKDFGYLLSSYLGFPSRYNLLSYRCPSDFFSNMYLTGIELGKQGSNVFNVIWRSTADIQMASHVDRVMRDRAVSRKRRFRIRC